MALYKCVLIYWKVRVVWVLSPALTGDDSACDDLGESAKWGVPGGYWVGLMLSSLCHQSESQTNSHPFWIWAAMSGVVIARRTIFPVRMSTSHAPRTPFDILTSVETRRPCLSVCLEHCRKWTELEWLNYELQTICSHRLQLNNK